MDVLLLIAVAVVVTMMGRPPQGAALNGGVAHDTENELPDPVGSIRFVREITVVETGYGEHANEVEGERNADGGPTPADPKHGQTTDVEKYERQDTKPIDLFRVAFCGNAPSRLRIEPANQRDDNR
jgi:hypothetical protein